METKYCIKLIKETYIDAENINEAEQIAEIMTVRESNTSIFGNLVSVYTEVEQYNVN